MREETAVILYTLITIALTELLGLLLFHMREMLLRGYMESKEMLDSWLILHQKAR